ncbi:MAG: polysaccharide export protein [Flavobacterium sp.]|nr:MAG: polysaccharide export protein [Flavobacterium sp.]
MNNLANRFAITIACITIFLWTSCASNKNITYFHDIPSSSGGESVEIVISPYTDARIKSNDILQISIQTIDPQQVGIMGTSQSATYATQSSSSLAGGAGQLIPGYLVDGNGIIEIPLVGKIDVLGKTTSEARDLIHQKAQVFYKNPVVNVRIANFEVTILGEVNRPARYVVPNERVSVLDAIGMAGDLTIYGKRENVLLIREENGSKKMVRFNLNTVEVFKSQYFYLRQGDIVYIEPNKNKIATSDATKLRTYTLLASGMSFLIIMLTRVKF